MSATITTHHECDVSQAPDLLSKIDEPIDAFYGNAGGYDHPGTYTALDDHEKRFSQKTPIQTVIPPNLGFRSFKKMILISAKATLNCSTMLDAKNGKS